MKRGSFYFLVGLAALIGYVFAVRKLEDTRDFR